MAIALIEVNEDDVQKLGVAFVLYGVYQNSASKKLQAAFLKMGELRKQMSEQHKIIQALQQSEKDGANG